MAPRARLSPPREARRTWPWHKAKTTTLQASILMSGERRMEAENYLAGGYGTRLAITSKRTGWVPLRSMAKVWQPSRLKGIQVAPEFGTPFLAATQVFDLRPTPRKFLAIDRTENAAERFVPEGMIMVTCSGNVGRPTVAFDAHQGVLISHDLLRIEPTMKEWWGWIYAYLRSPQVHGMMSAAQYGHIIKHLEVGHLEALPILLVKDQLRGQFSTLAAQVVQKRNQAFAEQAEAERLFKEAIGELQSAKDLAEGFTIASSSLTQRRRLEAAFHTPRATSILKHFEKKRIRTQQLSEVTERVWWMTRFKRVFGDEGVPYLSADELFAVNPPISKRVLVEQADNAGDYFVKAGWIVMACSGQVYGLNGSVSLMTRHHEKAFFSHDLIRIVPRASEVRPGYLFTALGHPELGRPLVIRYAYGTSIPHLDPWDIATTPIARLDKALEERIADHAERAVTLRAEADEVENDLARRAEELVDSYLAGDTQPFMKGLETI